MLLPGPKTITDRDNIVHEAESEVKKQLRRYSLGMSIVILVTGISSMVGWLFDIELFKRPLPSLIAMNPMTALSWMMLGLSLFLLVRRARQRDLSLPSLILAGEALLVGGLRLFEIITDYIIGIDHLLFPNKLDNSITDSASRHMSSATAFSLFLIGWALFLSSFKSKRAKYFANYPALTVFVIGLFSIIAHSYQVTEFSGLLKHFSMSVYTACCFFLISLAVLFVNSEVGFMRTFSSYYLGGTMSRFLIPAAILVPLFLGFVRLLVNWRYPISVELGVSMLIISIIVIFYGLIWFLAAALNKSDIARTAAESELRQMNEELEHTVTERTIELYKSEKRFRSLVENNDDIIALADSHFKTFYRSPASERITGFSSEERKHVGSFEQTHPDDKELVAKVTRQAVKHPSIPMSVTLRTKHKDGHYIWLEGSITSMLNDSSVNSIIINLRDITERKMAEERLEKINEELEHKIAERTVELKEAVKDLESFGYTVSHDLRTPLQVISAYSSILVKKHCDPEDEEVKSIIGEIKNYTRQMSGIIESLLHLSQSGREVIEKEKTNMNEVVSRVLAEIRIVNKDNITDMTVGHLPFALCDEGLIKLVWMNLILNAVKYSRKVQHPTIEIGSYSSDEEIVYYVKDNGVGFDMKNADKLFIAFQRLSQAAEFEGSGIGLAIVHRIVTRHGGRVWAESKENEGATFYFTLA